MVYLSLSLESDFKGQKTSKNQIGPDVFNGKKNEQFLDWIFVDDDGLPDYIGG